MSRRERPLGVTILALLLIIPGIVIVVGGLLTIFLGGFMAGYMGMGLIRRFIGGMMIGFGVVEIIYGALNIVVGWGLLKGMNWARIITIIFSILYLIWGVILLPTPLLPAGLFNILISILIIYYLTRGYVVDYFRS